MKASFGGKIAVGRKKRRKGGPGYAEINRKYTARDGKKRGWTTRTATPRSVD